MLLELRQVKLGRRVQVRTNRCVAPPSGYVQGMSDLLSPILYVMENEVDAFWCFVAFMDQMVSGDSRR